MIPYGKQTIDSQDIQSVSEVLNNNWITRGPKVSEFEQAIALHCGARHAVAFTNGSSALDAACFAAQVGKYDQIITSPNTFSASVACGIKRGAKPYLVDIDLRSGNLSLDTLENLELPPFSRGRNIFIPVHFTGIPVDMKRLDGFVKDPDTIIIEDAAHALGAKYLCGEPVGSCLYSHMTMFSFHPVKPITTAEGGIITTNDDEMARRLRLYRNSGIEQDPKYLEGDQEGPWYYEVQELTGNYHMTDLQAALGVSQLKKLSEFLKKRQELVALYRKELKGIEEVKLFDSKYDTISGHHLFVVQIDFKRTKCYRAELMVALKERGIETQVHYIPLYRHPFYRNQFGDVSHLFPNTESYYQKALSLPLYPTLGEEQVKEICQTLKSLLNP